MSSKAVLAALAGLLVLVGVALYLNRTNAPGRSAGPLADERPLAAFDPALVTVIEVTHPGSPGQRAERRPDGRWTLVSSRPEWPAALPPGALEALVGLSTLQRDPLATEAANDRVVALTIGLADRTSIDFNVAQEQLGGRARVWSGESSSLADVSTVRPLLDPGPDAWRVKAALPGARDASRIALETASGASLALARLENRWMLTRPLSARAEPAAVDALLGALASIGVGEFESPPKASEQDMGLSSPAMTIRIETDLPDAQGSADRIASRTLRIGGPANTKGDLLYALPGDGAGFVMTVQASAVASISTAVRNYLTPTATAVRPQDVFIVSVRSLLGPEASAAGEERSYRRELDGWVRLLPDGSRAPADAGPVNELLAFLSDTPGEADVASSPDGLRPLARISLFDLQGDGIEVITVGATADGEAGFRTGNVIVTHNPARVPTILGLPDLASIPAPGAPLPKPTLPQDAPRGK